MKLLILTLATLSMTGCMKPLLENMLPGSMNQEKQQCADNIIQSYQHDKQILTNDQNIKAEYELTFNCKLDGV